MPFNFGSTTARHSGSAKISSRRSTLTENNINNDGHSWKHLAEAARDEQDPKKLMDLIQQLNRALDEHIKDSYPLPTEAAS